MNDFEGYPTYSPPYDSPIEDEFAYHVVKYLRAHSILHSQFDVRTFAGNFRVDFVVASNGQCVGFECDGADYHDPWRDQWRDALILGTGAVGAMYRFSGAAITYHLEDCLSIVARWDRRLFSDRGLLNLETLASDEARDCDILGNGSIAFTRYIDAEKEHFFDLVIERRSLENGASRDLLHRAQQHRGKTLDEIIAAEPDPYRRFGRGRFR